MLKATEMFEAAQRLMERVAAHPRLPRALEEDVTRLHAAETYLRDLAAPTQRPAPRRRWWVRLSGGDSRFRSWLLPLVLMPLLGLVALALGIPAVDAMPLGPAEVLDVLALTPPEVSDTFSALGSV